jgi:hypothetical protein
LARRTLAILIPANPGQYSSSPEEGDRANIEAHRLHAVEHSFVYWNVPASGRNHAWIEDVKTMYFVRPGDEAPHRCDTVTHKGDIVRAEHFETKNDMRSRFQTEEVEFLYGTRINVWELERNGGYNWRRWPGVGKYGFIFFKIRNIRQLKIRRRIGDFARALGNPDTPVLRCRKYVIVFDEFFE